MRSSAAQPLWTLLFGAELNLRQTKRAPGCALALSWLPSNYSLNLNTWELSSLCVATPDSAPPSGCGTLHLVLYPRCSHCHLDCCPSWQLGSRQRGWHLCSWWHGYLVGLLVHTGFCPCLCLAWQVRPWPAATISPGGAPTGPCLPPHLPAG